MRVSTMRWLMVIPLLFFSCGKKDNAPAPASPPAPLQVMTATLDNTPLDNMVHGAGMSPLITIRFSASLDINSVSGTVSISDAAGTVILLNTRYSNGDSVLLLQPQAPLAGITKYALSITTGLQSARHAALSASFNKQFITQPDFSPKFPALTDNQLLDKVQQQTFRYFWDFAHPVSGLARERNTSGETVTSGGSGFGIMAIITAVDRGFITRAQALARLQTITGFLKTTAQKFHGAFPHWLNGSTGAVIPFSAKDNGADLVETAYLVQGLLCARQYFNGTDAAETNLRNDINILWTAVEWDWFRQNSQDVLYWHWSPDNLWQINLPVKGWNEALITYILAAASPTHPVPATVYSKGWASNGTMLNGATYYGYTLPLGPAYGGPLFFSHYSFLGINPNGLSDTYAAYDTQVKNHALIHYRYCVANPMQFYGYSDSCWGLTASDIPGGYAASSPTHDLGIIAPTAAIASLPYTPAESMKALKFFYYVLGDKIWKEYGFVDAFSLHDAWFAESALAIDQGPQIIMIENYRTQLLWNLFTGCPEIKTGMKTLGFRAPYL